MAVKEAFLEMTGIVPNDKGFVSDHGGVLSDLRWMLVMLEVISVNRGIIDEGYCPQLLGRSLVMTGAVSGDKEEEVITCIVSRFKEGWLAAHTLITFFHSTSENHTCCAIVFSQWRVFPPVKTQ